MRLPLLFLTLLLTFSTDIVLAQKEGSPQERGTLTAGKPTGVWEYYDGTELGLVINYDSGTVRYLRPDTTRYAVWLDSTWHLKRLSRAPRLLGSRSKAVHTVQKNLRYPAAALRVGQAGHVVVSFLVDKDGRVSEPFVEVAPHPSLGEEVRRVVNEVPLQFLPGIYRGRPVRTRVSFVVTFCISRGRTNKRQLEEAEACSAATPAVPGSFNPVVVTALGF